MNTLDALRLAFRLRKESQADRLIVAAAGKSPVWTPKDYAALSEAGFQNCEAVYNCITLVAQTCAGVPLLLFSKKGEGNDEEVESHPLLDLLKAPNPRTSGVKFIEAVIAYLLVSGNSYVEAAGPNGKAPLELYNLRPDRMKVIPGTTAEPILGYEYTVQGFATTYPNDAIMHMRTFHPTNDWYGLSPLEVGAKSIDISTFAKEWNAKMLVNDARPSGAFKTEKSLGKEQYKRLRKQIKSEVGGYENAGGFLLLEDGADWVQMGLSPKDMDFLNADKTTTRKICSLFKVPPELIGDSENKTYSNYQEARKALYMEAALPLLRWLLSGLNAWLTPRYGENLYLDLDLDDIEALQEDRTALYQRLDSAWFLTLNEKRSQAGYDEVPNGDALYIPMSLVRLNPEDIEEEKPEPKPVAEPALPAPKPGEESEEDEEEGEEGPQEGAGGANGEGDDSEGGNGTKPPQKAAQRVRLLRTKAGTRFWTDAQRKRAKWDDFLVRVKAGERQAESIVKKFLREQNSRVEERLAGMSRVDPRQGFIMSVRDEAKAYEKQMRPWYGETFILGRQTGAGAVRGELGKAVKVPKPTMTPANEAKLVQMIVYSGTKIAESKMAEVLVALELAESEAWSVEDTTQYIHAKLADRLPWESRRIARTETAKVENFGELEEYKETDFVAGKGWLCAYVELSRDAHIAADKQYADNPIPVDDTFDVDNEPLEYPGDPSGSPGNIINCLCTMYPEVMNL